MTNTELFIQRAIEGGWDEYLMNCSWSLSRNEVWADNGNGISAKYGSLEAILLDPLSWQAVGKVEGWDGNHNSCNEYDDGQHDCNGFPGFIDKMHGLIDALVRGETIEDYLGSILNHD